LNRNQAFGKQLCSARLICFGIGQLRLALRYGGIGHGQRGIGPQNLLFVLFAFQFRQELASKPDIPAISVFGYGLKTTASISLNRGEDGKFGNISYRSEPSGDNTILEKSTILPGTEIHPVQQHHGSLFVDNDVKMRLKLELARRFPK